MIFSASEYEQIRRYLGHPADPQAIANIVERCNHVQGLGAEVIETVRQILRDLSRTDQQIKNVLPFAAQTFTSSASGTRQSPPGLQLDLLKGEGRRLVFELSETLGLSIYRDIYKVSAGPARTLR